MGLKSPVCMFLPLTLLLFCHPLPEVWRVKLLETPDQPFHLRGENMQYLKTKKSVLHTGNQDRYRLTLSCTGVSLSNTDSAEALYMYYTVLLGPSCFLKACLP